jgi:hypothetical protein
MCMTSADDGRRNSSTFTMRPEGRDSKGWGDEDRGGALALLPMPSSGLTSPPVPQLPFLLGDVFGGESSSSSSSYSARPSSSSSRIRRFLLIDGWCVLSSHSANGDDSVDSTAHDGRVAIMIRSTDNLGHGFLTSGGAVRCRAFGRGLCAFLFLRRELQTVSSVRKQ